MKQTNLKNLEGQGRLLTRTVIVSVLPLLTAVLVFATTEYCITPINVHCAPLGAGCSGPSPNCPGQGNYTGTVSEPGNRYLVKSAPSGWWNAVSLPNCTFRCRIGPDCTGQLVNITLIGGSQATVDWGASCP